MTIFQEKFASVADVEFITCKDLEVNKRYSILKLENVTTKYGASLVGTIQAPDTLKMYKVYFPKRYGSVFTDTELEHLQPNTLWLVSRGPRGNSVSIEIVE